ncbi:MAG: HAD-IC family P-type ATPase, partial [Myxococcota bacterium]
SEDVEKNTKAVELDAALGDRKNMTYSGTTVTYGVATGIVSATGEATELGRINKMMTEVGDKKTPLLREIDSFGKIISIAIILIAAGFFAFGMLVRGSSLNDMFIVSIGIIVAAIPEGLPAILTITLALGVQRMARRHAIIRKLPSVETLGSVNVICSDKTGTLTRNEMTAQSVVTRSGTFSVEGSGYIPEGDILKESEPVEVNEHQTLLALLRCARACNDSSVEKDDADNWKLQGTATEGALTVLALKGGLKDFAPERLDAVPFESEHKYMATLNKSEDENTIFLKGAPERILEKCSQELTEDGEKKLDTEFWEKTIDEISGRGERVIACAKRTVGDDTESIDHDDIAAEFILLGLIGIIDPPRSEVVDAIQECKEAGIRVIMITGDHAVTANAVARQLGLEVAEDGAISGTELESMDDQELAEVVKKHNVFARTNPEHKLRLVRALQEQKLLCAMTGDGVNDAPALKSADIGIAMGIKGTDVTKEAAEMVLADDNFATIVHAVEEGRTIYDNIKKTILFLLPANGAEASVIIAAVLLGITLPITPVQILWVNMVSAVTLALCLTVEPMERSVMQRKPRKQSEPIIGKFFFWRVLFVSLLSGGAAFAAFLFSRSGGLGVLQLAQARTIAVNMLVIAHAFYLFSNRKLYESSISMRIFDNKIAFLMVGILFALQAVFTYIPFMNRLFGTAPVPAHLWPMLFAAGAGIFFIVEAEKFVRNKFTKEE